MRAQQQSLGEQALLEDVFGTDATLRFQNRERTFRYEADEDFLFACMHATSHIWSVSMPGHDQNYLDNVNAAFESAKLEDSNDLGIEDFFGELLQNSLDHNHGRADHSIEIEVAELSEGGLSYSHNGKRFGFEENSPSQDSTLTGIFKTFSKLKRYDFRIGRFGVGFKLWTRFFSKLNLVAIHNGRKFSVLFDISDGRTIKREIKFEETSSDDSTKFEFYEPNEDSIPWDEVKQRLVDVMSSYTDRSIRVMFLHQDGSDVFKSEIMPVDHDNGDTIQGACRINVSKNSEVMKKRLVLECSVDELAEKPVFLGSTNSSPRFESMRAFVESEYTLDGVEINVQEYFSSKFFKIVIDELTEWTLRPLAKQMQSVPNGPSLTTGIEFECNHFRLTRDRQGLETREFNPCVNNLILRQMYESLFEWFSMNVHADDFLNPHVFKDGLPELRSEAYSPSKPRLSFIDEIEMLFNDKFKDKYLRMLRNKCGNEIEKPRRLFPQDIDLKTLDALNRWFFENLPESVWDNVFQDVPFHQGESPTILMPSHSIVMDGINPYEPSELANVLFSNGSYSDFWKEFAEVEFIRENFPLEGNFEACILLNSEIANGDLGKRCLEYSSHPSMKLKFVSVASEPSQFGEYQAMAELGRKDIWEPRNNEEFERELSERIFMYLGGKSTTQSEINSLSALMSENMMIQKADISVWNEGYDTISSGSLVAIPPFVWQDGQSSFRSIEYHKDLNEPRGWIGLPSSGQTEHKKEWWDVGREKNANYPTESKELTNIIFCELAEEVIDKHELDEHCMLLIGSPFNSMEIMSAFGNAVLKRGTGFLKIDFQNLSDERIKEVLIQHEIPLPLSLEFSPLTRYYSGQYDVRSAQAEQEINGIRRAVISSLPVSSENALPSDFSTKDMFGYHGMAPDGKGRSPFFVHINNTIVRPTSLFNERPSCVLINFLPWERVFNYHDNELDQEIIASYSLLCNPVSRDGGNPGRFEQFALRFGKRKQQLVSQRRGSFAMANVPGDNQGIANRKNLFNVPDASDGIWKIKEKFREVHEILNKDTLIVGDENSTHSGHTFQKSLLEGFPIKNIHAVERGIGNFLAENSDVEVMGDWYNSVKQTLPENVVITVDANRYQALLDSVQDEHFKEFLTKLQQANPDEKRRDFEALLGTDGFDAEKEFLNNDLEKQFYKGYKLLSNGLEYKESVSLSGNRPLVPIISSNYKDLFLAPLSEGEDRIKYQKWAPHGVFREITGKASAYVIKIHEERRSSINYLIDSDLALKFEQLQYDDDDESLTEIDETPKPWAKSLELFSDLLNCDSIKYILAPQDTPCLIFGKKLILGKNGWDIRFSGDMKTVFFITSAGENIELNQRRNALQLAMKRVGRGLKYQNDSSKFLEEFRELAENDIHVFDNRWEREYDRPDYTSYLEHTSPDKIGNLYSDWVDALGKVVETRGKPAVSSTARKIMLLTVKSQAEFEKGELKDGQIFSEWYSDIESCAADEPIIRVSALSESVSSNIRLFRYNAENKDLPYMKENKKIGRKEWLEEYGLKWFFGGVVKLGAVFSRQAQYKADGVIANLRSPTCPFKQTIDEIASGHIIVPENKIVMVKDAILVAGQPGTLKVHVLHLVGMAALAEILREKASTSDD